MIVTMLSPHAYWTFVFCVPIFVLCFLYHLIQHNYDVCIYNTCHIVLLMIMHLEMLSPLFFNLNLVVIHVHGAAHFFSGGGCGQVTTMVLLCNMSL